MKEIIGVISPEGLPPGATGNLARHLDTLDGKTKFRYPIPRGFKSYDGRQRG